MPIAGIYGPENFDARADRSSTLRHHGLSATRRAAAADCRRSEWSPKSSAPPRISIERVKKVISPVEWPLMAPYIKAINELKQERNAVILAHNYQTPEIFHCVADIGGDSLQLARRSHQGEVRHHRAMRRALHGRDLEDPEPRQDGPDPGFARRLLAGLQHHRRRRAPVARALSRRAGGGLCQHIGRREGGGRHLLHVLERASGGREPQAPTRDLPAGPVSGEICRVANQREDHRLERRLRGA